MILGGPNNDFGGTKRVFGPHKRNLRGENNDFGGTNDLEFEGIKPGFWGDQTLILRGPTECLSLPNFHFLVNLGLQKYNNAPWATPFKNTVTPFGPPNFLWSPYHGSRGT